MLSDPDYAALHPGYKNRRLGLWAPAFAGATTELRSLRRNEKSDPRHHHVFDLDIFFHAVMRAFAAEPAFLDADERRHLGGDQPGIDADHAGFERLGDPPHPAEIARIEI